MATCAREIHIDDIGTAFRVSLMDCDVAVDITGSTTREIIFLKTDGTRVVRPANVYLGDPTLGIIEYLTVDGDLNQTGNWKIQAHVVLPTGSWWSDTEKFKVHSNL